VRGVFGKRWVCVHVYMCVYVNVCEREKERGSEWAGERQQSYV